MSDAKDNHLPKELLIYEIFLRLPIKSLVVCKCVCKLWNCMISSPEFARLHLKQSPFSNEQCLLINTKTCFLSFDIASYNDDDDQDYCSRGFNYEDEDYDSTGHTETLAEIPDVRKFHFHAHHPNAQVVASCDGLVCLNAGVDSLYVWNPSTLEQCRIPKPQPPAKSKVAWGLGHVASTQDYKLVRIHDVKLKKMVQVFSFTGNNWKEIDGHFETYGNEMPLIIGPEVSVNDMIYWAMNFNIHQHLQGHGWFIIGFDLALETFAPLPLPEWSDEFDFNYPPSLFLMERCLCMCWRDDDHGSEIQIAIFKEDERRKGSWTRLFHFIHDSCRPSWRYYGQKMLGITQSGRYVVHINKKSIILLDPNQNPPDDIRSLRIPRTRNVVSYVRSLISPSWKGWSREEAKTSTRINSGAS